LAIVTADSPRARLRPHAARRGSTLAVVVALSLLGAVPAALIGSAQPAAAYPTSTLVLSGHGYGHGIGMGQWGSLGYAIGADNGAGNFTYQQILAHYYGAPGAGSSSLETLGAAGAPAPIHGGNVLVAITENNGNDLIATAQSGSVDYPGGSATAVLFRLVGPGNYTIFTSGGCAGQGGWNQVATGVDNPIASPDTSGSPMFLCGPNLTLHGTLTALTNSDGAARTVNTVPLEQYVADVAPSESPTSWASLGGAGPQGLDWGFQQSEAQTVAARSYVEACPMSYGGDGGCSGGYADTCDQTCQSYPGTRNETLTSIAAAIDTTGQVMVVSGTSTVATTEYSASSGGYSTGNQFPAVEDAGDAVCISASVCNPNHNWTVSIPVSTIDATYPQIGTLSSFSVTSRNGLGDFGGRVNELTLEGSSGSVSMTGNAFAAAFNLKSNWFSLGDQPSGGVGGYWINAQDGGIFSFGNAAFYGSTGNIVLNKPVVGMAATSDDGGYWEVASDGGIFSFGDAVFHGSTGSLVLNKPVVGMATTPDGGGYWLVASDGGIFSFGDAVFYGSTGSLALNKPIVGMVPTHDGGGYWLIASDGGLFAFGDAAFHGSLGSTPPPTPIVGVAPSSDGGGYWMLEANGTVHAFGDAPVVTPGADSPAVALADSPMTAMTPDVTGQGFVAVDQSGQAFSFGDAPYFGDVATSVNGYSGRVVGIAATPG
jgi:SpoIID/LytB domain protein